MTAPMMGTFWSLKVSCPLKLPASVAVRCDLPTRGGDEWIQRPLVHLVGAHYSCLVKSRRIGRLVLLAVVVLLVERTLVARHRGYRIGGNTVVRCRSGHLFTTIWIPGASLKALRLEPLVWMRFQYCPVGKHWTLVTPVKESDLTDEEKRLALENRDVRIP